MNQQILICEFCELKRPISYCYKCVYCKNILCLDCCFGDDVTPEGVTEYCCDNNNDKHNKYKKIEHTSTC